MDLAELRDRPLVYVDDLDRPVLTEADRHHFERVLRVRPGDAIVLGDGFGGWRPARFGAEPEPTGAGGRIEEPADRVTVAFAPVKGERAEWFAQKLTELGVDEIVPVLTERTVVRWSEDRARKHHERMLAVAREACLQSRRLHLPTIAPATDLPAFLRSRPDAALADPSGSTVPRTQRAIVIGPEGGFTATERSSAPAVALPGHVLRATTAAVVAAAVTCGLRDGRLQPGPR